MTRLLAILFLLTALTGCGKEALQEGDTGSRNAVCRYNGKDYAAGASWRSSDGCNTCGCRSNGSVACTLLACAP